MTQVHPKQKVPKLRYHDRKEAALTDLTASFFSDRQTQTEDELIYQEVYSPQRAQRVSKLDQQRAERSFIWQQPDRMPCQHNHLHPKHTNTYMTAAGSLHRFLFLPSSNTHFIANTYELKYGLFVWFCFFSTVHTNPFTLLLSCNTLALSP